MHEGLSRIQFPVGGRQDIRGSSRHGEIQSTVTQAAQKNEKADEGFLSHRFRNISPRTLRGSGGGWSVR